MPGLFAEEPGQALLELADTGVEAGGTLVRGEQVSPQRGAGDCRAWFPVCRGRGGLQRVDLLEQVAVPVEEGAVDAGGAGDAGGADLGSRGCGLVDGGDDPLAAPCGVACRPARIFSVRASADDVVLVMAGVLPVIGPAGGSGASRG